MTQDRLKPFSYDVIETDDQILFVANALSLTGPIASVERHPGSRLALSMEGGAQIRFGNVDAMVLDACATKTIALLDVSDMTTVGTVRGAVPAAFAARVQRIDPLDAVPFAFRWHHGPCHGIGDLMARPFPSMLSRIDRGMVAICLGLREGGRPVALGHRSDGFIPLGSAHRWSAVHPRFLMDAAMLLPPRLAWRDGASIHDSVLDAFGGGRPVPVEPLEDLRRAQVALRVPASS